MCEVGVLMSVIYFALFVGCLRMCLLWLLVC